MQKIQRTIIKKYKEVRQDDNDQVAQNENGFGETSNISALNSTTVEKELVRKNLPDHMIKERESRRGSVALGGPMRYLTIPKPKVVEYEAEVEITLTDVTVEGQDIEKLDRPLAIYIDGPFGSPSSNIFRAEHAVLVCTGIGVTPFAAILQSIMCRYNQMKTTCPSCNHSWGHKIDENMFNLKKVDFIWVNRDQKSFEWFVNLLSELEAEQQEQGGEMSRFLEMHMYVTSALEKTDMKAISLQMAFDLVYEKEHRDVLTGLKSRTHAGRPNWNKVFTKLNKEDKGKVTVFYCGNPTVGKIIQETCSDPAFNFKFRKEVF